MPMSVVCPVCVYILKVHHYYMIYTRNLSTLLWLSLYYIRFPVRADVGERKEDDDHIHALLAYEQSARFLFVINIKYILQ